MNDATSRKSSQLIALSLADQTKAHLRSVLLNTDDAVLAFDPDPTHSTANRATQLERNNPTGHTVPSRRLVAKRPLTQSDEQKNEANREE